MTMRIFGAGRPSRRRLLGDAGGIALGALIGGGAGKASAASGAIAIADALGPARPFSFAWLKGEAEKLARRPFEKPVVPSPDILDEITYDEYQRIRYRADKSLQLDPAGRYPVQFFHLATWARTPVRVHVVEAGAAREVIYSPALFDIPPLHPARKLAAGVGFAGFRVMAADPQERLVRGAWRLLFSRVGCLRSVRAFGARHRDQYGDALAGRVSALQRILARRSQ